MDFVRELLESEVFNTILAVTHLFTKQQHYIAAETTWTVADVTDSYIKNICRLCGLLRRITSDCSGLLRLIGRPGGNPWQPR